jgi:hypothetical protein
MNLTGQNLAYTAVAILVLVLAVFIWNPFVSDEDRISLLLTQIENEFYLAKGENKVQYATRVASLKRFFDQNASVNLKFQYRDTQPVNGREDIKQAMIGIAGQLNEFRLNFYDTDIRIHEDGETATLQTSCEINYQGDELVQASDMSFDLEIVNGDWRIKSVVNDTPWEF